MKNLLYFITVLALLTACSSTKNYTKLRDEGLAAYQDHDYTAALAAWDPAIHYYETEGDPLQCPLYGLAGQAALNLDDEKKGIDYLVKDTYTPFVSAQTYSTLGYYYHSIDNLSKELDALIPLYSDFPEERVKYHATQRLFDAYARSENWDGVLDVWQELSSAHQTELTYLTSYLEASVALNNDSISDAVAGRVLNMESDNILALEYEATKYYNQAEERYQTEMEAYEKNKTTSQYKKLLKALDQVTADFKTAKKYFLKLYALQPDSKYAIYLSNIYARLDDKKKAAYYKSLAEE